MNCKICGNNSKPYAKARIIDKYNIEYFRCSRCGFVQTEEPYWLEECYREVINRTDIGYVNRNVILSRVTAKVINHFFDKRARFLDYGSGYGLFVRLMRDSGYDFYWQDKFCDNIFAKGFEAERLSDKSFELATAFELFEHFVNPVQEIEKILMLTKNIFISTFLFPDNHPKPEEWWYYGLEHGQHVSLYSYESLEYIAHKYKLNLISNRKNLHILSSKKINPLSFKYINYYNAFITLRPVSRMKPLTDRDVETVMEMMKKEK